MAVDLTVPLSWKAAKAAGGDAAKGLDQLQRGLSELPGRPSTSRVAGGWDRCLLPLTSAPVSHTIRRLTGDRKGGSCDGASEAPESLSASNLNAEIRFKAVAGKIDQAGGIVVRLQDADNYYVARANALEDNVRFYRVVNGRREQLGGANLRVTPNEWHTLGLRAEGERFTVSYDGKTLFGVTDKTFAEAGGVALWTKADSVTRFDRLTVTPLP